jgi:hypothetical protein
MGLINICKIKRRMISGKGNRSEPEVSLNFEPLEGVKNLHIQYIANNENTVWFHVGLKASVGQQLTMNRLRYKDHHRSPSSRNTKVLGIKHFLTTFVNFV